MIASLRKRQLVSAYTTYCGGPAVFLLSENLKKSRHNLLRQKNLPKEDG
jgi:hypothetical protein